MQTQAQTNGGGAGGGGAAGAGMFAGWVPFAQQNY